MVKVIRDSTISHRGYDIIEEVDEHLEHANRRDPNSFVGNPYTSGPNSNTRILDFLERECYMTEEDKKKGIKPHANLVFQLKGGYSSGGGGLTRIHCSVPYDEIHNNDSGRTERIIRNSIVDFKNIRDISVSPGEIRKAVQWVDNAFKAYRSKMARSQHGGYYSPNLVSHSLFTVIPDGELYHHGILGMKWGVRRFQNEDGSLTDAGRKRYGLGDPDYQRKKGIKTSEEITQTLNRAHNATEVAKDIYNFRKSTGNESQFKTGEAHARATENYANYLSKSISSYKDMLTRRMPKDVSDKYISHLLQQEVNWLNNQYSIIDEGVKIVYSLDTSRGLNNADFKLEFMYPDERKVK